MKPLHHYLRRFCSEQVQLLLERMDNHFGEEFALVSDMTKWDAYIDSRGKAFDYYTKIEAYCVSKTRREQEAVYKRQLMLNGILERTMSRAVTKWEYEREQRNTMREDVAQENMSIKPSKILMGGNITQQAQSLLNQEYRMVYGQQHETPEQQATRLYGPPHTHTQS